MFLSCCLHPNQKGSSPSLPLLHLPSAPLLMPLILMLMVSFYGIKKRKKKLAGKRPFPHCVGDRPINNLAQWPLVPEEAAGRGGRGGRGWRGCRGGREGREGEVGGEEEEAEMERTSISPFSCGLRSWGHSGPFEGPILGTLFTRLVLFTALRKDGKKVPGGGTKSPRTLLTSVPFSFC